MILKSKLLFLLFSSFFFSNVNALEAVNCNTGNDKEDFTNVVREKYLNEARANYPDSFFKDNIQTKVSDYSKKCSQYLCENFFGTNSGLKDINCPDFSLNEYGTSSDWKLNFKKDDVYNKFSNYKSCRDPWNAIGEKYKISSDKAYYYMAKVLSPKEPQGENVKSLLNNCGVKFCQAVKNNWKSVNCGGRELTQALLKFDYLEVANDPKDALGVSQGKSVSKCRWAKNLPRRVMTSCGGTCVGYVICKTKNSQSEEVETMRMATCSKQFCGEDSAQACVDDKSVGSRTPENDKGGNYITDESLIKASEGNQQ